MHGVISLLGATSCDKDLLQTVSSRGLDWDFGSYTNLEAGPARGIFPIQGLMDQKMNSQKWDFRSFSKHLCWFYFMFHVVVFLKLGICIVSGYIYATE